jgi:hypothetical protein
MSVVLELRHSAEQTSFNLRRWEEVQADPDLAKLPHRIETDRYGNIVMSPPSAMPHGVKQAENSSPLGDSSSAGDCRHRMPDIDS